MKKIKIFYSPDADDAFMMYGLAANAVDRKNFEIELEREDIEALNQRALKDNLDVTATSVHAYAYLSDRYKLLTVAASFAGENYGPRLLSKNKLDLLTSKKLKIAVPGAMTSANLAMRLFMAENKLEHELINMEFSEISKATVEGIVDGGVVIHEGQLTHDRYNLEVALDLGKWWWNEKGGPLPLGIMVVNKSFTETEQAEIKNMIQESIRYSLSQRVDGLKYAQQFRRELSIDTLDQYVDMYVNNMTVDMGDIGRESISLFLNEGKRLGIISKEFNLDFL